jgi:peptidoglycan-associated lipoprotein
MQTRPIPLRTSLAALAAAAALAACSSVKLDDAPVESRTGSAVGAGAGGAGGAAGSTQPGSQTRVAPVDATSGTRAQLPDSQRIVYFDYDSYVVRDDARPIVEANARLLAADRARRMSVEGHTDARGSSEYNLALGQRRAEAVVRSLTLLGAQAAQLEAVSFGKERPAAQGDDEAAFAKNRRAELNAK